MSTTVAVDRASPIPLIRALVAVSLGVAAGICGLTAGMGLTGSWSVGWFSAALAAVAAGAWACSPALAFLDDGSASRGLRIVSGLATGVALVQLARLAFFMLSPSHAGYSLIPSSQWKVQHSCLSAYFVAGQAEGEGLNFYDGALYTAPDDKPTGVRKARMIGPFKVDV